MESNQNTGPYETEAQAREAVRAIYEAAHAANRRGVIAERNHQLLEEACTAAGVGLGAYDHRILTWLSGWEPQTCAVIAGLIIRAGGSPDSGFGFDPDDSPDVNLGAEEILLADGTRLTDQMIPGLAEEIRDKTQGSDCMTPAERERMAKLETELARVKTTLDTLWRFFDHVSQRCSIPSPADFAERERPLAAVRPLRQPGRTRGRAR